MSVRAITVGEVKEIAYVMARKHFEWGEHIPDFKTRSPNVLESCLAVPFQEFGGKGPYKSLEDKGAMLFYLMIKNHPFQNGNKRIALTSLLVFMAKNSKWIRTSDTEFYNLAKWVAESNPKLREGTVVAIEKFISTYVVALPKS